MRDNPLRLYKYRSLSGEFGREAIERAILQNQLYWQSPQAFNDPFDCMPVLYFGDNKTQRKQFFTRAAKALFSGPRNERRQRQREMSATPTPQMAQSLMEQWPIWLSESAVTCFSEVPDHPLMWGHYADSHKGVCLIFDEMANEQTPWFCFSVKYRAARPCVNLTKFNDPEVMMSALFHKSIHWAYECEHRMMQWRQPPGYREFPPKALSGIILGAKICDDDKVFTRNLLLQRPGLEVYQAAIDEVEFKLNIVSTE